MTLGGGGDWTPWTIVLHGDGHEIHRRDVDGRAVQFRVWSQGCARVLALGSTDKDALMHLVARLADVASCGHFLPMAADPAADGSCDQVVVGKEDRAGPGGI